MENIINKIKSYYPVSDESIRLITSCFKKHLFPAKTILIRAGKFDRHVYFNKSVDKYINLTNRLLRRFYRGFSNDLENVRNSLLCVIILSNNPCQKQR